MTIAQVLR